MRRGIVSRTRVTDPRALPLRATDKRLYVNGPPHRVFIGQRFACLCRVIFGAFISMHNVRVICRRLREVVVDFRAQLVRHRRCSRRRRGRWFDHDADVFRIGALRLVFVALCNEHADFIFELRCVFGSGAFRFGEFRLQFFPFLDERAYIAIETPRRFHVLSKRLANGPTKLEMFFANPLQCSEQSFVWFGFDKQSKMFDEWTGSEFVAVFDRKRIPLEEAKRDCVTRSEARDELSIRGESLVVGKQRVDGNGNVVVEVCAVELKGFFCDVLENFGIVHIRKNERSHPVSIPD